ncbi:unnamed protein product [marine sediment metagenome]|uniref:Uncharacterized protein n=1 Tax=marine sediment metagenome TaxID=412755 RepID=X1A8M3_9ZZZZ
MQYQDSLRLALNISLEFPNLIVIDAYGNIKMGYMAKEIHNVM